VVAANAPTVWIPVYKTKLDLPELLSLWQTATMLRSRYDVTIAGKNSHRIFLYSLAETLGVSVRLMPDSVFRSVNSYCNLLLSPKFYQSFAGTHVLVAQLDAWVVLNCFDSFLQYDYAALRFYARPLESSFARARCIGVGVGGLSLRRCKAHVAALKQGLSGYQRHFSKVQLRKFSLSGVVRMRWRALRAQVANRWSPYRSEGAGLTALGCNEDWILGIYCHGRMRVAPRQQALAFGIDGYFADQLDELSPDLPFGLHGWYRDLASLLACRPLLAATLCAGWAEFLGLHGFAFPGDDIDSLFETLAESLRPLKPSLSLGVRA